MRLDPVGVDALAQVQLAQERTGLAFTSEPLDSLATGERALGTDRQQLAVDVDVNRPWVNSGEVGAQDIRVTIAVEVHGHEPWPLPGVEEGTRHAVQLAEWVKIRGHILINSFFVSRFSRSGIVSKAESGWLN
jgi:hypothetical protein